MKRRVGPGLPMRRRCGYTLVELVLVLMLLTFVAVSVFLLTDRGSAAFTRLAASRDQSADLRIALSYMDVRLKKIDGNGSVSVRSAPFGGGQALVLGQKIEGQDYETILYVDRGMLRELFVKKGMALTPDLAAEIARADGFEVQFANDSLLALTLTRGSGTAAGSNSATAATSATAASGQTGATGSTSDRAAAAGAIGSTASGKMERATQWVYLRAAREVLP